MRRVILFLFLCHAASAVTHSLQYFYTASTGIPDFPEFVNLGMLDGVEMVYYDSNIRKVIPKQDWMAETEGPEYWESETQISIGAEQTFKVNIETAKSRFNQTGEEERQTPSISCKQPRGHGAAESQRLNDEHTTLNTVYGDIFTLE
ncbi:H-2 class I histocompatibility antigen, Q9 alpha chain-like protein [Lates japonicus]|uniref:H-2 class I histocompatibility antigen, Q9 alpha chain-like protein n=1 Tax=Lates japonicus TaxID=270547 RepID=A0AAD3RLY3_LATJO|nr:H-2 class I histocompatibility antigen, Q9 alpha chain-like protein [Lates japonicus]